MASVNFDKLPDFRVIVVEAINAGLTRAADALSGKMVVGMTRTAKVPLRAGRRKSLALGRRYFPSRPGQPPAVQTGALRHSIHGTRSVNMVSSAGTGLPYGLFLERGTRRGLLPRPWLMPALTANKPLILSQFKAGANAVLQRGSRAVFQ